MSDGSSGLGGLSQSSFYENRGKKCTRTTSLPLTPRTPVSRKRLVRCVSRGPGSSVRTGPGAGFYSTGSRDHRSTVKEEPQPVVEEGRDTHTCGPWTGRRGPRRSDEVVTRNRVTDFLTVGPNMKDQVGVVLTPLEEGDTDVGVEGPPHPHLVPVRGIVRFDLLSLPQNPPSTKRSPGRGLSDLVRVQPLSPRSLSSHPNSSPTPRFVLSLHLQILGGILLFFREETSRPDGLLKVTIPTLCWSPPRHGRPRSTTRVGSQTPVHPPCALVTSCLETQSDSGPRQSIDD